VHRHRQPVRLLPMEGGHHSFFGGHIIYLSSLKNFQL
jgi:hypothetical protein